MDAGGSDILRSEPRRFVPARTATYVDKILKGAKPADLPVERPTKFEPDINVKAARDVGLTINRDILLVADEGARDSKPSVDFRGCWQATVLRIRVVGAPNPQ